ncbi:DUF4259 domain-containing protein [Streptomyces sp. DSM 44915]|uniref:DUF4259 domain-containing protein n=1 Tax=Streptomyces chisholmiae TaxID=3075540 RepID=A0ABU2JLR1_9ACTN|nr:DUF4259 domain-containing protein [Streptomyces sp. DSM 44915]MDT0265895.1 DUF4259 domain-containing protein [Streptomyces sp. DSM 44915]
MGTWGHGNFDSDTAADHLALVIDRLVTEVGQVITGDPVRLEADEYWGVAVPCQLELLTVLARAGYGGGMLPKPEAVAVWRERYLSAWERSIDELEPSPEFRAERLAVLRRTFDEFAAVSAAAEAERAGI